MGQIRSCLAGCPSGSSTLAYLIFPLSRNSGIEPARPLWNAAHRIALSIA
jgi:hypothetical protein